MELLVMGQETQSEFEKALIPEVVDPTKKRPSLGEFFKYLKTLCTYVDLMS